VIEVIVSTINESFRNSPSSGWFICRASCWKPKLTNGSNHYAKEKGSPMSCCRNVNWLLDTTDGYSQHTAKICASRKTQEADPVSPYSSGSRIVSTRSFEQSD
jgi:hypothetical protein